MNPVLEDSCSSGENDRSSVGHLDDGTRAPLRGVKEVEHRFRKVVAAAQSDALLDKADQVENSVDDLRCLTGVAEKALVGVVFAFDDDDAVVFVFAVVAVDGVLEEAFKLLNIGTIDDGVGQ